jgi:hypothetical protein
MSLNILKSQVKYCLLSIDDEEIKLLKQKQNRNKSNTNNKKVNKLEKNLKYFELQQKYKTVSKNVLKYIKALQK